jgi:hypothetical protein
MALEKSPDKRQRSASALGQALREARHKFIPRRRIRVPARLAGADILRR